MTSSCMDIENTFHTIGGRVPAGLVLSIDQRGKILNLRSAPYETQVQKALTNTRARLDTPLNNAKHNL